MLLETQFNNILVFDFPLVKLVWRPTAQAMVEHKAIDTRTPRLPAGPITDTINSTFINLLAATFAQATPICAKKQVRLALKLDVSLGPTLAGVTLLFTEGGLI